MISALRKTRPRPVCTFVAVTKSWIWPSGGASKSITSARMSLSGIGSARIESVGRDKPRDIRSRRQEASAKCRASSGRAARRAGCGGRGCSSPRGRRAPRRARALPARPCAAVREARRQHRGVHGAGRRAGDAVDASAQSSSRIRSSTPQVKAPCAPPPCKRKVDEDLICHANLVARRSFRSRQGTTLPAMIPSMTSFEP